MPTPPLTTRWVDRFRSSELPRDVHVLSVIAFLVAVGFGVMIPVLPVFARSFGVSNLWVGAVISSFAAFRLVTSPFLARVNEAIGERVALGIGMCVVALSSGAAAFSQNFWQLLGLRAVGGIGSAMFTVAAMTLLLRSVPASLRGRASARYSGGFLLGGMAGPAVGGVFAKISLTAPFLFYAVMLLAAGTVGVLMLSGRVRSGSAASAGTLPEAPMPLADAWRDVRYRASLFTMLAQGWQSFGVRSSLVPVLVVEVLLHTPSATGVVFAIAAVVQTIALGPVGGRVDLVGRRPMMVLAGLITGVATLAIPWSPTLWALTIVLCIYGVGAAMHATAPAAAVGDVVGGRGGTPIAVFQMMSDVGAIIGPLLAGWLADQFSVHWAFAAGAVLLIGAALYSLRMPREAVHPAGAT